MAARTLEMLVDLQEPGWPLVRSWIDAANNAIEILPSDRARAAEVLVAVQVGTRSTLGAVVWETGGLLVDDGWVRLLGGGGPRMIGDLASWNGLGPKPVCRTVPGLCVVAHDAAGGVFALDGGAIGPGRNAVYYLAPDTLRWMEIHRGYSHFLEWLCTGDVAGFSARVRWEGWETDVAVAGPDRAFAASPPRWTVEGRHSGRDALKSVPMPGLFHLQLELARQMGPVPG